MTRRIFAGAEKKINIKGEAGNGLAFY